MDQPDIFYNGRWVPADSKKVVEIVNPATEELVGTAPDANAADVDAAVRAAHDAFLHSGWSQLKPADRGAHLSRMADHLEAHAAEAGTFITSENGTQVGQSIGVNGHGSAGVIRYYASLAGTFEVEEDRGTSLVRKEPVGVAALIIPWNGPHILAAQKLGPALAMGCAVVIKPAAGTSLDIRFITEAAAAAGIPDGIVNVVCGDRETGSHLVEHELISHVSFTGSAANGRAVAAACGQGLKSVTLELGGKSAAILLDDANVDTFLAQMPWVCLGNSGQGCFMNTRVVVDRSRYEEVCDGIVETLRTLPVGDPLDPATAFGPVANSRQHEQVLSYIESGRSEGARVLIGGGRPTGLDRGFFVEATVFTDVAPQMRIFREEIFGPVLVVVPADGEEDAIAIANDSEYGLGGVVYTGDRDRGNAVARRIDTGTIGVNGYTLDPTVPFGGVKHSGLGRELGPEGLQPYFTYKSIYQESTAHAG